MASRSTTLENTDFCIPVAQIHWMILKVLKFCVSVADYKTFMCREMSYGNAAKQFAKYWVRVF